MLIVVFMAGPCLAAVGQSSFEFMLLGSGARAAGMGEAFTAVSGDVDAPFFNPASAGVMTGSEVSFSHVSYIKDVTLERFAFLSAGRRLRFGGGLQVGRVADIERRGDYPSGQPLGTFNEHNVTASLYWALPASSRLSVGSSVKWAYEKLDLESASAIGFDFGGFYSATPQITIGASIRNVGSRPKFVNTAFDLPGEFRVGASYRTGESFPGVLVAADFIKPEWGDKSSKVDIGAEYIYQDLAYFRLGSDFGYESRSFSAGLGLTYRNYYFDYAFIPIKHNLGNTHRITVRIRI